MNTICPYCESEHVSRMVDRQLTNQIKSQSTIYTELGLLISKYLPIPISPWIKDIVIGVVGGLIDSLIQQSRLSTTSIYYFHCHDCQRNFD